VLVGFGVFNIAVGETSRRTALHSVWGRSSMPMRIVSFHCTAGEAESERVAHHLALLSAATWREDIMICQRQLGFKVV
jgi:hypothetical protein